METAEQQVDSQGPALLSQRNVLMALGALAVLIPVLFGINYILNPATLPVKNVSFEGPFKHVNRDALAQAVAPLVSGNFLLLNLNAIKTRAESVPWVYQVSVRREWPDGVHIRFTEQTLAARWGDTQWINTAGDLVDLGSRHGPAGLPLLSGPQGTQAQVFAEYQQLDAFLVRDGLPITSLTLTTRGTWRTVVGRNLLLVLGHHALNAKLARFLTVYMHALSGQRQLMRRVDLRYSNGFAVQWRAHAGATADPGAEG